MQDSTRYLLVLLREFNKHLFFVEKVLITNLQLMRQFKAPQLLM